MSLVLSLIDAYLLRHPEDYCQWVRSYLQWRWDPKRQRMWSTRIGGHYRRAACYANLLKALPCVCKYERLVEPKRLDVPIDVRPKRRGARPSPYRVSIWA